MKLGLFKVKKVFSPQLLGGGHSSESSESVPPLYSKLHFHSIDWKRVASALSPPHLLVTVALLVPTL